MWLKFFLAMFVCALLVYIPGFLFSTVFVSNPVSCLAVAPLISVGVYELLAIVYGIVGIPATWVTLALPSTLIALVACLAFGRWRAQSSVEGEKRKAGELAASKECLRDEMSIYLPYLVFGCAICLYYFIKTLDGPASFIAKTDNSYHLNLIH